MSSEDPEKNTDDVLDILSNPLSRYILSVLVGVDPGVFTESLEASDDNSHED